MKQLIFSLFALFIGLPASTAQDDLSAIAYSITGQVKYAPSAADKLRKLRPGMQLARVGRLQIRPGSSLGISYDGEYAVLNTSGTRQVSAVLDDVSLFRETDLAELFGDQIDEAINPYFLVRSGFTVAGDPPPPPPPKKERDGHGNKEYKIIRIQPTGGKVAAATPAFRWKVDLPDREVKKFNFTLLNSNGQVLFESPVRGLKYVLDPADYRLEGGKTYRWKVSAIDDPSVSTPPVSFDYVGPAVTTQVRNDLSQAEMYQQADRTARQLMEAATLEQAGFLSAAYDRYREAARKNKKNQLAQLLFQSFRWRYDIIE